MPDYLTWVLDHPVSPSSLVKATTWGRTRTELGAHFCLPRTSSNTSAMVLASACYLLVWYMIEHDYISQPLSLPLNRTACPYFCSFVINPSPCLTTSVYCLFLSSGRFVSMIPLTRSMVQGMRSAAMNFARSLGKEISVSWIA